jgi:Putative prokaryotic signal transducing protein
MRVVYQAESIIDANLVKNALEHEGIVAFVSGQYLTGGMGELPVAGLVSVMVSEVEVERALPIVAAINAALAESPAEDAAGEWSPDPGLAPG